MYRLDDAGVFFACLYRIGLFAGGADHFLVWCWGRARHQTNISISSSSLLSRVSRVSTMFKSTRYTHLHIDITSFKNMRNTCVFLPSLFLLAARTIFDHILQLEEDDAFPLLVDMWQVHALLWHLPLPKDIIDFLDVGNMSK